MKILYGITKSNFGGAQRYVFDLATEAKKAGHDVAVLCGAGGVLVDKLRENKIRVIEIEGLKRDISVVDEIRSFYFIFRTLVEENPDVFHTNSSKMGGVGNLAARLAGVRKIIFTAHGWAFNEPRPLYQKLIIKFFVWLTILLSHKTICVSEQSKTDVESWPFIRSKLTVVHNGVEKFEIIPREQARRALGIHDDTLVVGTLAELHPIKGLDLLIEAWDKFSKNRHVHLMILGEGEARKDLEELITVLGLTSSVTLKGYMENARQYLHAFDIFCLPSRSENLPYAILEAGIAGLPTIASEVGGIPEIIETGINGVLVEKENPEIIFSTLLLLAENAPLRERLGVKLKEDVTENFSVEKMLRNTLASY